MNNTILTEKKAYAYELVCQINFLQRQLQQTEGEIQQLGQQQEAQQGIPAAQRGSGEEANKEEVEAPVN